MEKKSEKSRIITNLLSAKKTDAAIRLIENGCVNLDSEILSVFFSFDTNIVSIILEKRTAPLNTDWISIGDVYHALYEKSIIDILTKNEHWKVMFNNQQWETLVKYAQWEYLAEGKQWHTLAENNQWDILAKYEQWNIFAYNKQWELLAKYGQWETLVKHKKWEILAKYEQWKFIAYEWQWDTLIKHNHINSSIIKYGAKALFIKEKYKARTHHDKIQSLTKTQKVLKRDLNVFYQKCVENTKKSLVCTCFKHKRLDIVDKLNCWNILIELYNNKTFSSDDLSIYFRIYQPWCFLADYRKWSLLVEHGQWEILAEKEQFEYLEKHKQWDLLGKYRQTNILERNEQWETLAKHHLTGPLVNRKMWDILLKYKCWEALLFAKRIDLLIENQQWRILAKHDNWDILTKHEKWELLAEYEKWDILVKNEQWDILFSARKINLLYENRQFDYLIKLNEIALEISNNNVDKRIKRNPEYLKTIESDKHFRFMSNCYKMKSFLELIKTKKDADLEYIVKTHIASLIIYFEMINSPFFDVDKRDKMRFYDEIVEDKILTFKAKLIDLPRTIKGWFYVDHLDRKREILISA